jgi:hypothetical protein
MPKVTIQVLPAVAHPVNASGFLMADDAVWTEHAAGGFVYTEEELVSGIALRFDSLRAESYRASESLALIERLEGRWKAGASPLTRTAMGGNCVEAASGNGVISVRDSADRGGATMSVPTAACKRFADALK